MYLPTFFFYQLLFTGLMTFIKVENNVPKSSLKNQIVQVFSYMEVSGKIKISNIQLNSNHRINNKEIKGKTKDLTYHSLRIFYVFVLCAYYIFTFLCFSLYAYYMFKCSALYIFSDHLKKWTFMEFFYAWKSVKQKIIFSLNKHNTLYYIFFFNKSPPFAHNMHLNTKFYTILCYKPWLQE